MTSEQSLLFGIMGATMLLFIWGRLRYDVIAISALLFTTLFGIVPAETAFYGLGHPAVITVAAILIISKALEASGLIDILAEQLLKTSHNRLLLLTALSGIGALLSGFMNNVGALALLMPIALKAARDSKISPALILMPLSFGTILGGLTTLMGTPPNIIIATYRESLTGEAFAIFDFAPVGITIALAGIVFIVLTSHKLIPRARRGKQSPEELFEINEYIVEVIINHESKHVGSSIKDLDELSEDIEIIGLLRGQQRYLGQRKIQSLTLETKDILIIEADPSSLTSLMQKLGAELVGDVALQQQDLNAEDIDVMEVVVMPGSRLEKRSFQGLRLRSRYGIALLGIARQGKSLKQRLRHVNLKAGDILLVQGESANLYDTITRIGCLPLAKRGLKISSRPQVLLPLLVFIAALAVTAASLLPIHISFCFAVLTLIISKTITMRTAYEAIDWPIILLLGAMLPLGQALQTTGSTDLITGSIAQLNNMFSPLIILAIIMVITMMLSDIMNNTATAVIMAPIAAGIANQLGVNADAFLMAVAIGASCAFLTPIGHQNNILVMGPGGYHFSDYWRLGLPLEIMIVVLSVPLIGLIWPLH